VLKGIDPLLYPELLKTLAEMGHGDEIVLADANFTAASLAGGRPVLRLPGVGLVAAVRAVASIFPLDEMVDKPVAYMQVGGTAEGYRSALQREVVDVLVGCGAARADQLEAMERFAFYERTRRAYAIVQTGELEPWGNVLLKKGVLAQSLRR
jgi:L-fucose mutarotase